MDDFVTNNLFNNPITGGDKNNDFLAAEVATPPASETGKSREERPVGGPERGQAYRKKTAEKAKRGAERRKADPAMAKDARKLHSTRGELTDATEAGEVEAKIQTEIEEGRDARKALKKIAEVTKKIGENPFVRDALPILGLMAVSILAGHADETGQAYSAALLSALKEGHIAASTLDREENGVVSHSLIRRGHEEEAVKKSKKAALGDKAVAYVSGALSSLFGEGAAIDGTAERIIQSFDNMVHASDRVIVRLGSSKGKRETTADTTSTDTQTKFLKARHRMRNMTERSRQPRPPGRKDTSSGPTPSGPGRIENSRYRERRKERRKSEREQRKVASSSSSSEHA